MLHYKQITYLPLDKLGNLGLYSAFNVGVKISFLLLIPDIGGNLF